MLSINQQRIDCLRCGKSIEFNLDITNPEATCSSCGCIMGFEGGKIKIKKIKMEGYKVKCPHCGKVREINITESKQTCQCGHNLLESKKATKNKLQVTLYHFPGLKKAIQKKFDDDIVKEEIKLICPECKKVVVIDPLKETLTCRCGYKLWAKIEVEEETKREIEIKAIAQQCYASYLSQKEKEPSLDLGKFFDDYRSQQSWGSDDDFCNEVYHSLTRLLNQPEPIDKVTRDKEEKRREIEKEANDFIENRIIKLKSKNVKEVEGEWRVLYPAEVEKQRDHKWWAFNPLDDKVYEIPLSLAQIQQWDRGGKSNVELFAQSLVDTIQELIRENPEHKDNLLNIIDCGVIYHSDKEKFYVIIDTPLWRKRKTFIDWGLETFRKISLYKTVYDLDRSELNQVIYDSFFYKILKGRLPLPHVWKWFHNAFTWILIDFRKKEYEPPELYKIYEELKSLPKEIEELPKLSPPNKISHNAKKGYLIFKGVMTEQDRNVLEYISNDPDYIRAIENLYNQSQIPQGKEKQKKRDEWKKEQIKNEGPEFSSMIDWEDWSLKSYFGSTGGKEKINGEERIQQQEEEDEVGISFFSKELQKKIKHFNQYQLLKHLVRNNPRRVYILELLEEGEKNAVKKAADKHKVVDSTIYRDIIFLTELRKKLEGGIELEK
jgi:hypothetical protein